MDEFDYDDRTDFDDGYRRCSHEGCYKGFTTDSLEDPKPLCPLHEPEPPGITELMDRSYAAKFLRNLSKNSETLYVNNQERAGLELIAKALESEGGSPRDEGLWLELDRLGCGE